MNLNPLKGMRDFAPSDMIIRQYVMDRARNIFEKNGFDPLETPAVESLDVLQGKYGSDEKLIWKFKDLGERDVALRYDLTVPLSRFISKMKRMPMPFKRYQMGRVWRYDNPQKGRYREFWQCDIDTVGTTDVYSDAEILKTIYQSLKYIGFDDFVIRINNRKLSDGILEYVGVKKEKVMDVLRSIDKIDKFGKKYVIDELNQKGFDGSKIIEIISGDISNLPELNQMGKDGLNELTKIVDYLKSMKVPTKNFKIDLTIARGLNYYTGMVYEASIPESDIGSISGGGRYDNLIGRFLGRDIPAVGGSLGLERIVDILKDRKFPKTKKDILLIPVKLDKKDVIDILENLRKKYNVDVSFKKDISKGIQYAQSIGIKYVCFVGKTELDKGVVRIKNLETGEEREMNTDNLELF